MAKVYCPLTVHNLRHSRGVELALAGASDAEIMSQLEHATDCAAKIYRRQSDRRRMADAGQDRVDKVVSIQELRQARDTANGNCKPTCKPAVNFGGGDSALRLAK